MDYPAGFTAVDRAADGLPELGVGLLGYGFMGRAHSNAYLRYPMFYWPPVARPRMVAICGRTEPKVAEAARRFGWEGYYTDWRRLVDDPRIRLFDNSASANMHVEPTLAAIQAGKAVICEKPLATDAPDALRLWRAAQAAGVVHATGFNYRFVPAVRFIRQLIDEGKLGRLLSFRGRYLQSGWETAGARTWSWRYDRAQGGYGALGDIGVHIIDLARFLMGEIAAVSALSATFTPALPLPDDPATMGAVTVDDQIVTALSFSSGALGTLEASKVATGRLNQNTFEINGSLGSVSFDLERLNEIELYLKESPGGPTEGFRTVSVTERTHPFCANWWPHGHILGWEHSFVNEIAHLFGAIQRGEPMAPYAATFEDGYKALAVGAAMERSAREGLRVAVVYEE